jgi:hypothetical protein
MGTPSKVVNPSSRIAAFALEPCIQTAKKEGILNIVLSRLVLPSALS